MLLITLGIFGACGGNKLDEKAQKAEKEVLSYASLLISQQKDALRIKERLGHADVQTTLGTYGHLYPNSLREIANDLTGSIQTNFSKSNLTPETKNQFTTDKKRNNEHKCDQTVTTPKENR